MADPLKNGIKLIVAIGGFVAKPSLLDGLRTGVEIRDLARNLLARAPPGIGTMADDLTAEARATFDGMKHELRLEAEILFEQMVETALPDPRQIVADGMDAGRIVATMLARHTEIEHTRPPMPDLFRAIVTPAFARLLESRSFADDLTPAFMAEVLGDLDRIEGKIDKVPQQVVDLLIRQGLIPQDQPDGVPVADLTALAGKFGAKGMTAPGALLDFLTKKAEEYREYRHAIDALDDRVAAIANLKGAAQDAAERLDFDEVETLLSRVDEVETEIAAETKEARARNALMRGRVEDAWRLLCAAADSFASVEKHEPARRRIGYAKRLSDHGRRYGGPGLALAARMGRAALDGLDRDETPRDWAGAQNNLGNALQTLGSRTAGPEGTALLDEAAAAYRRGLGVFTEAEHPADWATTMQNLGLALRTQGTRTAGSAGLALLGEAIDAIRAALRIRTEVEYPLDWASTMQNLGNALQTQGSRIVGPEGSSLLAEAVAAYREALRIFTEDAHPAHWALTMQNLGNVIETQGNRAAGPEGVALLGEAAAACRAALRVRTEVDHPVDWAMTMQNLGNALQTRGARTAGPRGAALLGEAVAAFREALRVFTEAAHPVDWAMMQENMALAEVAIAENGCTISPTLHLKSALRHVEAALRVFDPAHMAYNHEKAARLRARIAGALMALSES